jgi:hypothetical protein
MARSRKPPTVSVKAAADAAMRRAKGIKETEPRAPIDPPPSPAETVGEPKKRGRPPKLKDTPAVIEAIEGLARIQCTHVEAAAFFRVARETFEKFLGRHKKAAAAWESGRHDGLASLRRRQFEMAEHNATMSIWLGKQYLGQTDKQEQTHDVKGELATLLRDVDGRGRAAPPGN